MATFKNDKGSAMINANDSTSRVPVVIPAAGRPRSQVVAVSPGIMSAGMVPVNEKPVIGWILDDLIEQGFCNFYVLSMMNDNQIEQYCDWRYTSAINIQVIRVEESNNARGVGHSLYLGLKAINKSNNKDLAANILIILGHTIYRGNFQEAPSLNSDWIMTCNSETELTRWCYAKHNADGDLESLLNKPTSPEVVHGLPSLIGAYHLTNRHDLVTCLESALDNNLTRALEAYNKIHPIKVKGIDPQRWLDCGSIAGIQRTRKLLITQRARMTNSIEIDQDIGTLTKRTAKRTEILQQYLWYIGLPENLRPVAPRVYEFDLAMASSPTSLIKMEYYGYSTLEEAWLYKALPYDVWKLTLNHLFDVLSRFRAYKGDLSPEDFTVMYRTKTERRLTNLIDQSLPENMPSWKSLLEFEHLYVNNKMLRGWGNLKAQVWQACDRLFDKSHVCLVHGDFHLGNILYDFNSRLLKLIDPRGSFGSSTLYGDFKYDLAKLRHSIGGGYNYIVNNLFRVEHKKLDNSFHIIFQRPQPDVQQRVLSDLDGKITQIGEQLSCNDLLEQIKFIEGLLFLSMIPIHKESNIRQLAMYSIALSRLNEHVQYLSTQDSPRSSS